MKENNRSLVRATKDLMYEEPYYGLFLITLNKLWDNSVGTACVGKNGINTELRICPVFWEGLPALHKQGVLKHELMHICLGHVTSYWSHLVNTKIRNIAMDLEINQYIDRDHLPGGEFKSKEEYEDYYKKTAVPIIEDFKNEKITADEFKASLAKIPIRVIFLEDFAHLGLEPNKGTQYYYDKLMETMDQDGNSSDPYLNSMLGDGPGDGDPRDYPWNHNWSEFENLSEAEERLIKKQIEYQVKEIAREAKGRGTLPGEIKHLLDVLYAEEPPKFDWRGYFRRFAGNSILTYTRKSRRKPSKRFEDAPGIKVKQKKHILVGVDTSGSVSDEELKEFFVEIDHMSRSGVDVTVIQCDTSISHVGKYKRPEDGQVKVHGRGGTDFQPVVDYFNEHSKDFSCLVYLTDGGAPAPETKAKGKMLWVLSSSSPDSDHLPGPTIKLN